MGQGVASVLFVWTHTRVGKMGNRSLAAATSKLAGRVKNMGSCRSSFYARTLRGMDVGQGAFESLSSTAVETEAKGAADTSAAVRHAAESVKSIAGTTDDAISAARCTPGEAGCRVFVFLWSVVIVFPCVPPILGVLFCARAVRAISSLAAGASSWRPGARSTAERLRGHLACVRRQTGRRK